MCADRGYQVSDSELNQSLDDFKQQFGDRPRFVTTLYSVRSCVVNTRCYC